MDTWIDIDRISTKMQEDQNDSTIRFLPATSTSTRKKKRECYDLQNRTKFSFKTAHRLPDYSSGSFFLFFLWFRKGNGQLSSPPSRESTPHTIKFNSSLDNGNAKTLKNDGRNDALPIPKSYLMGNLLKKQDFSHKWKLHLTFSGTPIEL